MVDVGVTSGVGNRASLVGVGSVGAASVVAVAGTAVGGSLVAVSVAGIWATAVSVGGGVGVAAVPQAANKIHIKPKSNNKSTFFFTQTSSHIMQRSTHFALQNAHGFGF